MLLLLLALLLGVAVGLLTNVAIPAALLGYLGVAVLAALDSCLGGVRRSLQQEFSDRAFVSGFVTNTLLAGLIVFIGESIGVGELYLAAVVAFGVRAFNNLARIRHLVFERLGWE